MKSNNRCKKVIFGWVLVFSLIFGNTYIPAFAETGTFTDTQGVMYNYDTASQKAEVASVTGSYYLNIEIPEKINYGSTDYDVVKIRNSAFSNAKNLESVRIEGEKVESIGERAFQGCSGLTSVEIPSSVKSIGKRVFDGCENLTSIEIPSSITTIEEGVFANCKSLTSVTIPSGVTSIGESAFVSCSGLTSITISSGVKSIGECAFQGCSRLTSVEIPESVESIGRVAFAECSGLTSVTIPSSVSSIEERVFYLCNNLTSIEIPEGVTSIGEGAFRDCSGLTSVSIPSTVTSIGWSAFQGCNGLTSVSIPSSVTSIEYGAFQNCSGLTSVSIPDGVTSIKSYTFKGCSGLTSVSIPSTVTSIEESAFQGCNGLTNITIPYNVTSIQSSVFKGCDNLKDLYVSNSLTFSNLGCGSSTNIWRYMVKKDEGGKSIVKIVSRYQGSGTSIKCDGMGEKYVVDEIEVSNVELTHKDTSEKTYTWEKAAVGEEEEEAWKCTANMTCDVCGKPLTEAVVGEPSVKDPATCMGKGTTTYTATFTKTELGTDTKDVVDIPIDEDAHSWKTPTYIWEKEGETWKCTATIVCKNNSEHTETETVVATPAMKTKATCNENGTTTYTATFTKTELGTDTKDVVDIPIDEDAHSWKTPTYSWEKEGETWKCVATRVCENNPEHTETEEGVVTHVVNIPATCNENGMETFTATFTKEYFAEQTKDEVIPIDEDAHPWNTPRYRWEKEEDTWTCTATRVCKNNPEHKETETVVATIEVTTPATCTQPGAGNCIATFTNPGFSQRSIPVEIPAGHKLNYEERVEATTTDGHIAGYTCEMCGQHFSDAEGTEAISDEDWVIKATALLGDVTGDGSVNIKDYVKLYRYVQGLTTLTEEEKARADVNKDGSINIKDYVRLYRYVQGLIETL